MEHPRRPESARDAGLVEAARSGDRDAFSQLVETYFDPCWEVSWRILHDRERAAEVAQDVMLAAWQQLGRLEQPGSFGGWVLRMARNRSLDRLAHERRATPTDEPWMLEPRGPVVAVGDPEREALRQEAHDLVWEAAAALGERDASILDLHLRHGLEARELAGELGIAPNAANQALFRMRTRLGTAIRARMLWHGGSPSCVVLAAELVRAGVTEFGAAVVRVVDRHATGCDECGTRQRAAVGADAMFAAVPWVAVPAALKESSAQALMSYGVPVPASWGAGVGGAGVGGGAAGDGGSLSVGGSGPAGEGGSASTAASASSGESSGESPGGLSHRTVTSFLVLLTLALVAGGAAVVASTVSEPGAPRQVAGSPGARLAPRTDGAAPTPSPSSARPLVTPVPLLTPSLAVPSVPPTLPPTSPPSLLPVEPAPTVTVDAVWIGSGSCPTDTPFLYRVQWTTTDSVSAILSGTGGSEVVPLDGQTERCGPHTGEFTVTATGPGGEASETDTVRPTPAG